MNLKPKQIQATNMIWRQLMNKFGNLGLTNKLQRPLGYFNVSQRDRYIDFLSRKLCPIHRTPLTLRKMIRLSDDDTRVRYICNSCRCSVDFAGDEMKSGSVGPTLDFIELFKKDVKEFTSAKINPTSEGGIEV